MLVVSHSYPIGILLIERGPGFASNGTAVHRDCSRVVRTSAAQTGARKGPKQVEDVATAFAGEHIKVVSMGRSLSMCTTVDILEWLRVVDLSQLLHKYSWMDSWPTGQTSIMLDRVSDRNWIG